MKSWKKLLLTLTLLAATLPALNADIVFPSEKLPSAATVKGNATLRNNWVSASFKKDGFSVRIDGKKIQGEELFTLVLGNGERVPASAMTCSGIKKVALKGDPEAIKLSERFNGQSLVAKFTKGDITVAWRAVLRDGSHYIRQELKISAKKHTPMQAVLPLEIKLPGAKVLGNTRGSPVVTDSVFTALETPMAFNEVSGDKMTGKWSRKTTLKKGEIWDVSSVIGALVPGQERRSFLAYNERERAVPWRSFVHYNSWYELNINRNNDPDPKKRMSEAQCLDVIDAWNKNLFKKHKISIDAFVWDDGWDDFNSLWGFHSEFPNGFAKLDIEARKQNAGMGAWLGPVGGYGASKAQRLGFWNKHHPNNQIGNFDLSNKEYFDAFVGRCSQMVDDYDMRYFKFDGISAIPVAYGPGNEEAAEGIIKVEKALREKRGDIFLNTTVGTWASPFWFHIADSVWRQDGDHGQMGVGNPREKWITYRDDWVHKIFVTGSPLFPINSLMTHGLMVTRHGPPNCMANDEAGRDGILKEMRCAFACGSALQELYVDNDIMTKLDLWKDLAECMKWFRGNADVLDDTHWVGGEPWNDATKSGDIYGWASWNGKKATLALRNSDDEAKTLTATLRQLLDVPAYVQGSITLKDSFKGQRKLNGISGATIPLDKELTFKLKPFEVFVFDGKPAK
ncbi:MAG: hypothetical protein IJW12_04410 [Opitutales bacterium]|nr:hypothetical protein [Opitutales bacterium]